MWEALAGDHAPPTVLLGHSMGGAIAVRAAASQRISSLAGLVVVDVVEGTALQVPRRLCCASAGCGLPAAGSWKHLAACDHFLAMQWWTCQRTA